MRAAPTLGLVIALLVIAGASLGVGSGRAQPSASTCAQGGDGSSGNFTAHAGLGVHVRTLRFDGVEATIKPLRSASGLSGCERLGALAGIGSTVAGTYLVVDLYAQARLPTGFVSHYQWAKGGPTTMSPQPTFQASRQAPGTYTPCASRGFDRRAHGWWRSTTTSSIGSCFPAQVGGCRCRGRCSMPAIGTEGSTADPSASPRFTLCRLVGRPGRASRTARRGCTRTIPSTRTSA